MKKILPADLDVSEGSHSWNLTRPTALIAAEICEFILPEVIKLIWPSFAYSTFLDYHAETRAMARLEPTAATGEITITGKPETVIPAGSLFAVPSVNNEPSIDYETLANTRAELAKVREQFFSHGADVVMIDGALSRKTLCSRKVTEATILCTGASYNKNIDTVIEDTAYNCEILTLPETADEEIRKTVEPLEDFRGTIIFGEQGPWTIPSGLSVEDALRKEEAKGARAIFFGGALSDFLMKPLLMSSAPLKGLTFVVRDSSKILLKRDNYDKIARRGITLEVLDTVNLVAVTVNPFSAYGFHFSKEELMSRMEAKVGLPVINVMEDAK